MSAMGALGVPGGHSQLPRRKGSTPARDGGWLPAPRPPGARLPFNGQAPLQRSPRSRSNARAGPGPFPTLAPRRRGEDSSAPRRSHPPARPPGALAPWGGTLASSPIFPARSGTGPTGANPGGTCHRPGTGQPRGEAAAGMAVPGGRVRPLGHGGTMIPWCRAGGQNEPRAGMPVPQQIIETKITFLCTIILGRGGSGQRCQGPRTGIFPLLSFFFPLPPSHNSHHCSFPHSLPTPPTLGTA